MVLVVRTAAVVVVVVVVVATTLSFHRTWRRPMWVSKDGAYFTFILLDLFILSLTHSDFLLSIFSTIFDSHCFCSQLLLQLVQSPQFVFICIVYNHPLPLMSPFSHIASVPYLQLVQPSSNGDLRTNIFLEKHHVRPNIDNLFKQGCCSYTTEQRYAANYYSR